MIGFTRILVGCRSILRPDGFLVITARPFRRGGTLVDIPAMAADAAVRAGFVVHERCVALLAAAGEDGLTTPSSLFQIVNSRNAFARGNPVHIAAHEEVIVAKVPGSGPRPTR
jgi:hypothetical protein